MGSILSIQAAMQLKYLSLSFTRTKYIATTVLLSVKMNICMFMSVFSTKSWKKIYEKQLKIVKWKSRWSHIIPTLVKGSHIVKKIQVFKCLHNRKCANIQILVGHKDLNIRLFEYMQIIKDLYVIFWPPSPWVYRQWM